MKIASRNHYIPQMYLHNFASGDHVQVYRLLVPDARVSLWRSYCPAGIGYHRDLYTRSLLQGESDDIEQWLGREVDTPASLPLRRAVEDERMYEEDYVALSKFVAAQVVRTPAYLTKNLSRWQRENQAYFDELMSNLPERLRLRHLGEGQEAPAWLDDDIKQHIRTRVLKEDLPDERKVSVRVESTVGFEHWFFAMKVALKNTWKHLAQHRWTILHANDGLPWFTTDDPVLCLNFNNVSDFDFGGGWGRKGSEIILPLSPEHLLYTQVGKKPPQRGSKLSLEHSIIVRSLIARHAHRYIYAKDQDDGVPVLRPRHESRVDVAREEQVWSTFQTEQRVIERDLLRT